MLFSITWYAYDSFAIASGLKRAIPNPFEGLPNTCASTLGIGTAMFVAADGAMTRLLGIGGRSLSNAMVCVASLATIPVGHAVSAAAQVAILCATLATATAARSRGSEPTLVLRLALAFLRYRGGQTGSDPLEQAESRPLRRRTREHQIVPASARA